MSANRFINIIKPATIVIALITASLSAAGFNWQYCIFPFALLTFCFLSNEKNIGMTEIAFSLFMILCLLFSVFFSKGDMQNAIYEAEKQMLFIISFCIGKIYGKSLFHKAVFVNALIIAFVGIIAYIGKITSWDLVLDIYTFPRLQSSVQYANTAACLLCCGYISFLHVFSEKRKKPLQFFGALILLAAYLTLSKACIPLFLIISTLLMWKCREIRSIVIYQNIITAIAFLPIAFCSDRNMNVCTFILVALAILISGLPPKLPNRFLTAWVVLLVVCTALAIILIIRDKSILGSLIERFNFMNDAVRVIKNEGIFGTGPGSWKVLQYKYQTYSYSVTYIHNSFLQIFMENGIVFLLMFVGLLMYSIYKSIRNRCFFIAAIISLISLHSLIDFDMSFSLIGIITGIALGIGCNFKNNSSESSAKIQKRIKKALYIMLATCLCITNIYMISEFFMRRSFEQAYINGNYEAALDKAENLEKICPKDPYLQVSLASLENTVSGDIDKIRTRLKKAVTDSPNDYKIYKYYMSYAKADGSNIAKMCLEYLSMCPEQSDEHLFVRNYALNAYQKNKISIDVYNEIISKTDNLKN